MKMTTDSWAQTEISITRLTRCPSRHQMEPQEHNKYLSSCRHKKKTMRKLSWHWTASPSFRVDFICMT